MQTNDFNCGDGVEILPPEQSEEEREEIRREALADSARDLTVDERYVMRRLASVVANDPKACISLAGCLVTLPVVEFATSAGLTFKVARRRLDHATEALFARVVSFKFNDGGGGFCWVDLRRSADDFFELNFSGPFLRYLRYIAADAGASRSLQAFASAVNAPVAVARGVKIPGDLSVVLISRKDAHTGRPKGMTKRQLNKRLEKRLKRVLGREGLWDAIDALAAKGPLRAGHTYARYTHKDIDLLYNWVMENKDKPDYLEF